MCIVTSAFTLKQGKENGLGLFSSYYSKNIMHMTEISPIMASGISASMQELLSQVQTMALY